MKNLALCYLFIFRYLSTQNEITKQWQNDDAIIQSKVPIKVQNVHNIKSLYPMFMSSFHGPVRITSLEWKLCHMSLILKDDWQIRGIALCYFIEAILKSFLCVRNIQIHNFVSCNMLDRGIKLRYITKQIWKSISWSQYGENVTCFTSPRMFSVEMVRCVR